MYFPVIVHKEANSDYGVIVPDCPGVFSGGQTLEEALENVEEALALRFCDDQECLLPRPSSIEAILASEDATNGAVILLDLDPGIIEAAPGALAHLTLPLALKDKIDSLANARGITSAELVADALACLTGKSNG